MEASLQKLARRGPDFSKQVEVGSWLFGHARLSILDTSTAAHQPIADESGRYWLVFNGEIYNFKEIRDKLRAKGFSFSSSGDTEVLLKGLVAWGEDLLPLLNGFFAFAFYDAQKEDLLLVRDRMGIKPLWYSQNKGGFFFASEQKALYPYGVAKELNPLSLRMYFRMGYIPGAAGVFKEVYQLLPGHLMRVRNGKPSQPTAWYRLPETRTGFLFQPNSWNEACHQVRELTEAAVRDRLVSDVPLGSFLSGGIDSSVVVAAASQYTDNLHTFSIGFKDQPYFDETRYAEEVALKFNTNHRVFSLSSHDLLAEVDHMLDYLDMPFGDSSALPVYILSKETSKHVTVALSGDGGDELFSGYHKHRGEWLARKHKNKLAALQWMLPILNLLPSSRHSSLGNKIRQMKKLLKAGTLSPFERYRLLAGVGLDRWPEQLLRAPAALEEERNFLLDLLGDFPNPGSLNDVLRADLSMVLPYDMLTKVDLMSMAHSLEVRVPLLDYRLVDFVHSLPQAFKMDGRQKKKLLIAAFSDLLPEAVYNRPKKGFEVPLLDWFRGPMEQRLKTTLDLEKIEAQGILNAKPVANLLDRLHAPNPGELHFKLWTLIVWQSFYDQHVAD